MDLSEEPGSFLNFLRDRRTTVMEGRLRLILPNEAEIVMYDHIISQLDRELIRSKKIGTFAISGINGPQS